MLLTEAHAMLGDTTSSFVEPAATRQD
jgi:hypothetical protein